MIEDITKWPKIELKIEKFTLTAKARKLKPGWKAGYDEDGNYTLWYEEPEFLKDEDVMI